MWTSKLLKQLCPFKDLKVSLPIGKAFESMKISGANRIERLVKPGFYLCI